MPLHFLSESFLFRPRGTDNIEDYETNFRSVVMDAEATNASTHDSLKRYDAEHDIYTVYLLDATLTLVRDWESGAFHGVGCGAIGRLARLSHGDAAVTEYAYDVHSWPVSQQTTYGTATNTSATARQTALGYTLEYAPCFNGNISKRVWDEGSYTYTYDALNRLTSAVFTPAEGLADRPAVERNRVPDFSVYYDYDLRGNTTNIVRYGVVDAVSDFDRVETFGTLDELACSYEGNQMRGISAITEALPFDGVTGLHANGEFELSYNKAGDMVSDASRGLLYTRWNADGHPMQYDIEGGHRQRLGWDSLGNHLYTSYEMAVAPVSAGALPGRTRRTSIRAYSGDGHVLRGGEGNSAADTLEMLRFAGGYFDGQLTPHYYITDYLGSNIAVIRSDGALVQSTTYYPYGEPHRDPSASAVLGISVAGQKTDATAIISNESNATLNPYLFHNKRLDLVPRTYEYPLRKYVSIVQYWSSMDPYAERYPHLSPYCSFACNPIRYTDETGGVITIVSVEDQTKFYEAMAKLFNDKAGNFSFNSDGQLKYNGDTKGLSRDQKNILDGLRKVMDSKENTTISFGKSITIKDKNGNDVKINTSDGGGAFTILQAEAIEKEFDVSSNIILIDPDATSTQVEAVTDAYYGDWSNLSLGARTEIVDVLLNVPDMISHEIGHVLNAGKTQDKVIDFNNKARKIGV